MTELTEVTVHLEVMEVATRSSKRLYGLRGRILCPRPFLGGKVAVGQWYISRHFFKLRLCVIYSNHYQVSSGVVGYRHRLLSIIVVVGRSSVVRFHRLLNSVVRPS